MKKWMVWVAMAGAVAAMMLGSALHAQDIAGTWQGTLHGKTDMRIVVKIAKADNGTLAAKLYNIDRGGKPLSTSPITVQGGDVKFTIPLMGGSYEGMLSADHASITGGISFGGPSLPLDLAHVTDAAAWAVPEIAPVKMMARDANPGFEVATIKPNGSGVVGLQQLAMDGRHFVTRNASLMDMIAFAYGVQKKQIIGSPDWSDKDRYDIDGVPDVDGTPNTLQLRGMVQKLVADRFALKFHNDKREMPAFVLTVAKNGPKMTAAANPSDALPEVAFGPARGGLSMSIMNGSTKALSSVLQMAVVDRPVVDETGVTGKFDFIVTFLPDETQFVGRRMGMPPADAPDAAPSLFDAMQQQLGLKLSPEKTQVDVIVIDSVAKPTAN